MGENCIYDLDGDSIHGSGDLLIILGAFGAVCPE